MVSVFAVYAMFVASSPRVLPAGIKHVAHGMSVGGDKRVELSGGRRGLYRLCVRQRILVGCCSYGGSVFAVCEILVCLPPMDFPAGA